MERYGRYVGSGDKRYEEREREIKKIIKDERECVLWRVLCGESYVERYNNREDREEEKKKQQQKNRVVGRALSRPPPPSFPSSSF